MDRWLKLLCVLALCTLPTFASSYVFTSPSCPAPADPSCIFGDPLQFKVFGAVITSPTASDPNWELSIQTNYLTTIAGSGAGTVSPGTFDFAGFPFTQGPHGLFSVGDFLITWDGNQYGVALSPHDGLQVGSLYQVPSFLTAADVMNDPLTGQLIAPTGPVLPYAAHRSDIPVWLGPGGTVLGGGTLSGAKTGDGVNSALFTLTDSFSAPAGFLGDGNFSVDFSSFVCANGFLIEDTVPEPGTFGLLGAAILLVGVRWARQRS
jgi:hypothetical protein